MIKTFMVIHNTDLDIEEFKKNPVVLNNHDHSKKIGKVLFIEKYKKDNKFILRGDVEIFDKEFKEILDFSDTFGVTIGYSVDNKNGLNTLIEISLVEIRGNVIKK